MSDPSRESTASPKASLGDAGPSNHHGSLVVLGDAGVLIEGHSGSGKTTLAFALIERSTRLGMKAAFVADDQMFLDERDGMLVGSVPGTLAGKAELRGFGIVSVPHLGAHRIDLIARLGPASRVQRMPDPSSTRLLGFDLPVLELPERHESQAARIVIAWLAENRPTSNIRQGSP